LLVRTEDFLEAEQVAYKLAEMGYDQKFVLPRLVLCFIHTNQFTKAQYAIKLFKRGSMLDPVSQEQYDACQQIINKRREPQPKLQIKQTA
jgi:hypothetical protein